LLAIAMISAFCGFVLFVPEGDYVIPYGRDFAEPVSQEFLRALIDHQEARLKSLSQSTLWPKIDQWLDTHQEVDCDAPLWWEPLDNSPFSRQVISAEPNKQQMHLVLARECQEQAIVYCARLSDLNLVLTDKGWLIEDFGPLNEQLLTSTATCRVEQ